MDDFQLSNEIQPPDFRGSGSGKAFEKIIIERMNDEEDQGNATMCRYGVQASYTSAGLIAMQSLPDFEGVTKSGRQFIFDAKVASGPSFDLGPYRDSTKGAKARQLRHMLLRANFSGICSFLIHWNSRPAMKVPDPAETYWIHIDGRTRFWQSVLRGETKSIKRKDCEDIGYKVNWTLKKGQRKPRPDVLSTILEIAGEERGQSKGS